MRRLLLSFILVTSILTNLALVKPGFQYALPNYSYYKFDNGFELILVENRTNPIIATIVVTKTGLRNETLENNGVSHMLEHLTFNGTEKRTQKELYDELDFYGIYLNAQTSEDYTTYMALNHKAQIDQTLDIMSDMLFNSTFPEEKFNKEKGIVIEEIRKDIENNDFKQELELRKEFYQKPPYSMPVIGTIETIEKMTRLQVMEYYNTYYSPNNMIALVVGDLNKAEMHDKFSKYFASQSLKDIPVKNLAVEQTFPFYHLQQKEKTQILTMKLPAPTFYSDAFIPFQFYNTLGLDSETGRIIKDLKSRENLQITKAQSNYEFHPEFGLLTLEIEFNNGIDPELVKTAALASFKNFESFPVKPENIEEIQKAEAISEILQTDKILYYGFLKAQELAVGGIDAFTRIIPGIFAASAGTVNDFTGQYVTYWNDPSRLFVAGDWTEEVSVDSYRQKSESSTKSESEIFTHTFENGLRTVLLQNTDNSVLSMHFLFKDRSAWEPNDKTGIIDFLHRSLFQSTKNMSKQELQQALNDIGAEIKTNDWDFIPYDDYYNVPQFSYIRFLTLDQYFEKAIQLSYDNILYPNLEESFEESKTRMMSLAGRNQSNAREMAELHFSRILFGEGHPYAQSVSGSVETIENITLQDLQVMHQEYFTGGNTILAIVSSLDSATVFGLVSQYFGRMPATSREISVPEIPLTLSEAGQSTSDSLQIGSQQSYVYLGYTFQAEPRYEMPLELMTSMLSGKLAFSLREQKGWAYRLGSRISNWKDRYVFINYIGTGRETTRPAIQGILQEIEQFKQWDFQEKDLQREKNSITAALVRRRASRESQAYTLALNEFRGYPTSYYFRIYDEIKEAGIETIKQLRQEYLQTEKYHLFYTIPSAEEPKEKKMGMPQMKMPH